MWLLTILALVAVAGLVALTAVATLIFVYVIVPVCLALGFCATLIIELAKRQFSATVQ